MLNFIIEYVNMIAKRQNLTDLITICYKTSVIYRNIILLMGAFQVNIYRGKKLK